jgi:hypothetical protein
MTNKEKAIRYFAKAMKTADIVHMATMETMTLRMAEAWYAYIAACQEEVKHAKSAR